MLNKADAVEAAILEHEPDIMVVTETWLHTDVADFEVTPTGYTIVRKDRQGRGGGVAFLIKDNIRFSVLDDNYDIEMLWIRCGFSERTVYIGGIYRAPNSSLDIIAKLRNFMDSNFSLQDNVLLLGDFNLPDINWLSQSPGSEQVASAEQLLELAFCYGLTQSVTEFTRIGTTRSSILDLVFVSPKLLPLLSRCEVVEGLSDHRMVVTHLALSPDTLGKPTLSTVLNFMAADDVSILDYLERSFDEFQVLYNTDCSTDRLWHFFSTVVGKCIDSYVPRIRKRICKTNPWITREIIHTKRKLKRKRKSCAKNCTPEGTACISSMRQELKRLIKQSKDRFFNVTLTKYLKEAPSRFWRFVTPPASSPRPPEITQQRVDDFNSFFASVFTHDNGILPEFSTSPLQRPIDDVVISEEGVLNLLLNINTRKTPGPDGIPNEFLYRYAEWAARFLTKIFQSSLRSGSFPLAWKQAKITPVHKSGSSRDERNYRPISLISTCSKILEHIINKHLMSYLDTHNLLSSKQHGFRRGLSTTTQLIEFVHDLSKTINLRGQTDVVYLDFAKAFDKVSHSKLLFKIDKTFQNNHLTKWFSSYLSCRQQFVQIKNKQSRAVAVNSGVPQGSVLGPLLFLLYINDLPNRVTVPIRLFADDCVVYSRIETEHDQVNLNNNLQRIKDWCEEWQMSLNTEKTVFMTITRKKAPLDYNYQIGNAFLKRVQNYKYLGLWFTPDLRWNTHIDNVCSRATKALYSLRRNLYTAPSDIKCLAYKTLVRPIIEYSKIVWDPYTKTNCNKITKIQRLGARFIFNKYRRHHSPTELCKKAGLDSPELRTRIERLKFLFQLIHNHFKLNYSDYFQVNTQEHSRHRHNMYIPPLVPRNDCFKFSYFPRAIEDWNMLPESIIGCSSLTSFEQNLKRLFSE